MKKNTVIICQNRDSIHSNDGWQYSIQTDILKTVSHVYLQATKEGVTQDGSVNITDRITILHLKGGHPYIDINKRIDKACSILQSLLDAIKREDVCWNVIDYLDKDLPQINEEQTSVEGTVVPPSGDRVESTDEEQTSVEGIVIPPSKC